jgi:capsular exopolysaccharide synthesis family protein
VAEGKSTSTCNLAVSLAQNGQKVLLIDADLRKPKIQQYFGLMSDAGLTEILTGKGKFDEYVTHIKEVNGLDLLPSGAIPPNPTELLGTKKMQNLIQGLGEKYDMVIIDTPPVADLTDAAILGAIVDGVLLVVSAGETNIEQAKKAKKVLENVTARILGAVMAKVERQGRDRYYYYYRKDSGKV